MTDRNGPRAVVEFDPEYLCVRLAVITQRTNEYLTFMNFETGLEDTHKIDPRVPWKPSYLRMNHDVAQELLVRLGEFLGHHPETASLRKDYEAERARVDRFINYLTVMPVVLGTQSANRPQ